MGAIITSPVTGEGRDDDLAYQEHILAGVSRTFALTIPQLPGPLCRVVGNAYLLCRIADTIEDEPAIDAERTRAFSNEFIAVLAGERDAESFARSLSALLGPSTLDSEKELIYNTPRVIRITRGFSATQRAALERCVRIMSRGMAEFQEQTPANGLDDLAHLDRYCYHVAGVVGEMLTELFCDYSPEIGAHRERLMRLAVSFGQGLQMTNILKDVWEDRKRGACWLPRDRFAAAGYDLGDLSPLNVTPEFERALDELVGVARAHLANALLYTTIIPARETGIRRFCLWAIGMAVLTLRKVHARPDFSSGSEVKISRRSVRATVLTTSLAAGSDWLLRLMFAALTRKLPNVDVEGRTVSA